MSTVNKMKVNNVDYDIEVSGSNVTSGQATQGQVLTANGNGGASWQDGGGSLTPTVIEFEDSQLLDVPEELASLGVEYFIKPTNEQLEVLWKSYYIDFIFDSISLKAISSSKEESFAEWGCSSSLESTNYNFVLLNMSETETQDYYICVIITSLGSDSEPIRINLSNEDVEVESENVFTVPHPSNEMYFALQNGLGIITCDVMGLDQVVFSRYKVLEDVYLLSAVTTSYGIPYIWYITFDNAFTFTRHQCGGLASIDIPATDVTKVDDNTYKVSISEELGTTWETIISKGITTKITLNSSDGKILDNIFFNKNTKSIVGDITGYLFAGIDATGYTWFMTYDSQNYRIIFNRKVYSGGTSDIVEIQLADSEVGEPIDKSVEGMELYIFPLTLTSEHYTAISNAKIIKLGGIINSTIVLSQFFGGPNKKYFSTSGVDSTSEFDSYISNTLVLKSNNTAIFTFLGMNVKFIPHVSSSEKDKYLHTNASTGALEWATVTGGGGSEPSAYLKNAAVAGNTLTLTKKDDTTVVYTPDLSSKQDVLTAGNNITIENNVISATGEPNTYLKSASVAGNTLTLTNKDDTVVTFTHNETSKNIEYKNAAGAVQTNPMKFVKCTKSEYDAIATKDNDTFYIIVG